MWFDLVYKKVQEPPVPNQRKSIRDISSIQSHQVTSRAIKENKSGTFQVSIPFQVSVPLKSLQDPFKKTNQGHFKYQFPSSPFKNHSRK